MTVYTLEQDESGRLPKDWEAGDIATREAWLLAAIDRLRPMFSHLGWPLPGRVHVSVGFGYRARAENKQVLGQTFHRDLAADGAHSVFISPVLAEPSAVLATLLHELVHCADGCESGHRGRFRRIALAVGLTGRMTETVPGPELAEELADLATWLGPYADHAALMTPDSRTSGPKPQGTRMRKLVCPACGYTVRASQRWIDTGLPRCPCKARRWLWPEQDPHAAEDGAVHEGVGSDHRKCPVPDWLGIPCRPEL